MTQSPLHQPAILLVDDDMFYRKAVTSYLLQEGFHPTEASSGEEALALFEPGKFDVILLDLIMHDISGIDTLKSLRNNHPNDDTPIIVISGRDDRVALIEAINAGAIEYLTKPIDPTELIIRIRTLLRLRALQKQLLERERLLSQQKVLDNLTATIAHHINNAATSVLLLCESHRYRSTPVDWEHFQAVVEQQTKKIVRVVAALQQVKSLKDKTVPYIGNVEMIDIEKEVYEDTATLFEYAIAANK